ncbi:MAG: tetratricopeptide repeat protein [Planctomycetaceae bacterium]|jgi:tetratricopeptide (TPR) repeat protein|nr:tetratricopeptide repeat protein [Planctomycetaceae bacterium]
MKFIDLISLYRFLQSRIFVALIPFLFGQDKLILSSYRNVARIFCFALMLLFFASCNKVSTKDPDAKSSDGKEPSVAQTIGTQQNSNAINSAVSPAINAEIQKAADAFNKSNINNAKEILTNLYEQHPELPPPGIYLTKFFVLTKNGNVIKPVLDMTTNETPNDPEAYIGLGEIALQQRELTAAELLLEEGESKLSGYSANPERKKILTSSLLRIQSLLAEVRGRWESYGQLADKRIKHDGESAALLRQKGIALFRQHKETEAANLFAKADNLKTKDTKQDNNDDMPAEIILSSLYAERGENEKAKKFLADAQAKHPNSKEVILQSIQSGLNEDKPEEAKIMADKLAKDFPDFTAGTKIRASIALYLNDYLTAEKLFQDLIVAAPSDGQAVNGLALALCEQNDQKKLQRAIAYAQDNVNKNQQNAEYWSTLGWILFKANQIKTARQALQRSVVSGQVSVAAAYYLAHLEIQAGNKDEAKRLLEAALKNNIPFPKRRDAAKLLKELSAAQNNQTPK